MGTGDGSTFGEILSWNGQKDTPGNSCPRIYGSAGQFFPKYLKKDVIQFFLPDLQRSINLTFDREETVVGMLGYRYIVEDRTIDNGKWDCVLVFVIDSVLQGRFTLKMNVIVRGNVCLLVLLIFQIPNMVFRCLYPCPIFSKPILIIST